MNTPLSNASIKGLPWIAAIAFFMQSLDNTILNTAIPTIAKDLQSSSLSMAYAIISYALTVAFLIPISGWIADRFGTKRTFIVAVILFSSGSLLCALSSNLIMLIFSRIIQGVGGAIMMPVSRLTVLRTYPKKNLLNVMNFIAMFGLIGPFFGPILGGLLVTYLTWHWIFLINVPIGIVGIIFAIKFMPNYTFKTKSFDFRGFIMFSCSLVLLSCSISLVSEEQFSIATSLTFFLVGLALMFGYIIYAKKHEAPLIRLSLFHNRVYSTGIIACIVTRIGISSIPFLAPLMTQLSFNYSAMSAGMIMTPVALGSILAKYFVRRILHYLGYKRTLFMTTISISIAISLLYFINQGEILFLLILLFIIGFLMSTHFSAMNTLTLGSLSAENASEGNSILSVTQQLSISLGIACCSVILSIYESFSGNTTADSFHYTFATLGIITLFSSLIFTALKSTDGEELIK